MEWFVNFVQDEAVLKALEELAKAALLAIVPVVVGFGAVILRQISAWIKAHTTTAQLKMLTNLADVAYEAAKKVIDDLDGDKPEDVKRGVETQELEKLLAQYGIKNVDASLAQLLLSGAAVREGTKNQ